MGQHDALRVTHGSCIDFDMIFEDESGNPEDLTEDIFNIYAAFPSEPFQHAVLTKSDPENGRLHFHLPDNAAAQLELGNVNWVRIARRFPDSCINITEQIWIATR